MKESGAQTIEDVTSILSQSVKLLEMIITPAGRVTKKTWAVIQVLIAHQERYSMLYPAHVNWKHQEVRTLQEETSD